MLNDRDKKYEGQDESEYHFSDEDVSYEVEPPPTKPNPNEGGPKESLMTRLAQSKRMIISGAVFLVLVFVVYKMVAPTAPVQVTDITTPSPAVQQMAAQPPNVPVQQTQAAQAPAVLPPPLINPEQQQMAPPAPAQTVTAPTIQNTLQPVQQAVMAAQQQMQTPPAMAMPAVITVQSPPPVNQAAAAATSMGMLSAESQALMNQFQAETAQRLNDYAAQNKQLQEQMQALNTRVMNMEGQLNQLLQALTQHRAAPVSQTSVMPAQTHRVEQPKMPYNVQAIIPGRAWLRSDSGETVTVAEGDVIKDLGRVTKIDPYDGVVEVNTGTRVVSLSYGNGG